MERKIRYIWWGVIGILVIIAAWKFFIPQGTKLKGVSSAASDREIVVYITGAVESPGLVRLAPDARLDDALKQVKPLPEANLDVLNPAQRLKDAQKITIPYKPQVQIESPTVQQQQQTEQAGQNQSLAHLTQSQLPQSQLQSQPQTQSQFNQQLGGVNQAPVLTSDGKININTAGLEELDKLPGVGPVLAQRIIDYRTKNGYFSSPEELQNVSGIGTKTYEKMSSMIKVNP